MSATKFQTVFPVAQKVEGDDVSHSEWNGLTQGIHDAQEKVNDIIDDMGESAVSVVADQEDNSKSHILIGNKEVLELTVKTKGVNVALVGNNNINIEPRKALGTGADKSGANMKGGNISLKPGDDIELCSHHRGTSKSDEVSVKVIDDDELPVKLQMNLAELTLTTKDKAGNNANVCDVNINRGKNQKGYLKVRAQAIDMRCEENGGIALQPKGADGDGHMNKIKFEHGGGDGLEFGTFNSEKTSLFTDEYRFNKNGKVLLATRTKVVSDKYDDVDETTHYKYQKNQQDDFYDNVSANDPTCSWGDIVKVSDMLENKDIRLVAQKTVNGNAVPDYVSLVYKGDYVFSNVNIAPDGVEVQAQPGFQLINGDANLITAGTTYTYTELARIFGAENLSELNSVFAYEGDIDANVYWPNGTATLSKTNSVRASLKDIITLVDYFKTNGQVPFAGTNL